MYLNYNPFVIKLSTCFLIKLDFLKSKKINFLAIKKILTLLLEYLTKQSVKIEITNTSRNLEIEYKKGIIE